jgi:hypothetical protein
MPKKAGTNKKPASASLPNKLAMDLDKAIQAYESLCKNICDQDQKYEKVREKFIKKRQDIILVFLGKLAVGMTPEDTQKLRARLMKPLEKEVAKSKEVTNYTTCAKENCIATIKDILRSYSNILSAELKVYPPNTQAHIIKTAQLVSVKALLSSENSNDFDQVLQRMTYTKLNFLY